jgi:hypothetical protein
VNLSWRRGINPARLAGATLAGLARTVVLAVEGQVGPDPQFDPLALTVSDYAVADRGGATDWAMLTLAATSILQLWCPTKKGEPSRILAPQLQDRRDHGDDGRGVTRGSAGTATDGRFPATARASLPPRSRRR